jgi:hypothetical protein
MATRKNNSAAQMGGKRRKTRKNNVMAGGKRKATPWNKFVKKIYDEMKKKQGKAASFSAALKEASRRKSEM